MWSLFLLAGIGMSISCGIHRKNTREARLDQELINDIEALGKKHNYLCHIIGSTYGDPGKELYGRSNDCWEIAQFRYSIDEKHRRFFIGSMAEKIVQDLNGIAPSELCHYGSQRTLFVDSYIMQHQQTLRALGIDVPERPYPNVTDFHIYFLNKASQGQPYKEIKKSLCKFITTFRSHNTFTQYDLYLHPDGETVLATDWELSEVATTDNACNAVKSFEYDMSRFALTSQLNSGNWRRFVPELKHGGIEERFYLSNLEIDDLNVTKLEPNFCDEIMDEFCWEMGYIAGKTIYPEEIDNYSDENNFLVTRSLGDEKWRPAKTAINTYNHYRSHHFDIVVNPMISKEKIERYKQGWPGL